MQREPRLNVTLTFTLHDKTSNATNFWLFFDVAYVSPFKFCSVKSDQQQQRDMYATCDTYATISRRLNATFLRIQLPFPLVNNFAREARARSTPTGPTVHPSPLYNNFAREARPPVPLCTRPLYITILRAKRAHTNHCAVPPPVVDLLAGWLCFFFFF